MQLSDIVDERYDFSPEYLFKRECNDMVKLTTILEITLINSHLSLLFNMALN